MTADLLCAELVALTELWLCGKETTRLESNPVFSTIAERLVSLRVDRLGNVEQQVSLASDQ